MRSGGWAPGCSEPAEGYPVGSAREQSGLRHPERLFSLESQRLNVGSW